MIEKYRNVMPLMNIFTHISKICVIFEAELRGTNPIEIRKSKEFTIAVANKSLEKEVIFFGVTHGNEVDKFKATGLETESAEFIKPPLISKASVNFECKLVSETDAGDHIIFLGEILASYINPGKKVLFNVKTVDGMRVFEEY